MNNNDILRRIRFAFNFSDDVAVSLFSTDKNSQVDMDKKRYLGLLEKEGADSFVACSDLELCAFLDGFIVDQRGAKEGGKVQPKPADFRLSKNDVLKKLRIALMFREEDMLETLELGGTNLSKGELSALFRKPGHKHYRACGGQVLRSFLKGLTEQIRGE